MIILEDEAGQNGPASCEEGWRFRRNSEKIPVISRHFGWYKMDQHHGSLCTRYGG